MDNNSVGLGGNSISESLPPRISLKKRSSTHISTASPPITPRPITPNLFLPILSSKPSSPERHPPTKDESIFQNSTPDSVVSACCKTPLKDVPPASIFEPSLSVPHAFLQNKAIEDNEDSFSFSSPTKKRRESVPQEQFHVSFSTCEFSPPQDKDKTNAIFPSLPHMLDNTIELLDGRCNIVPMEHKSVCSSQKELTTPSRARPTPMLSPPPLISFRCPQIKKDDPLADLRRQLSKSVAIVNSSPVRQLEDAKLHARAQQDMITPSGEGMPSFSKQTSSGIPPIAMLLDDFSTPSPHAQPPPLRLRRNSSRCLKL